MHSIDIVLGLEQVKYVGILICWKILDPTLEALVAMSQFCLFVHLDPSLAIIVTMVTFPHIHIIKQNVYYKNSYTYLV